MQLGFVSALLHDLSLNDVLGTASELGYDCVEVMCWPTSGPTRKYGGITHIDCVDFTQPQADEIQSLCKHHGVEISALGYYANHLSDNAEESQLVCEHLCRVIDAAVLLGLKNVNAFVGANQFVSLDENFERFEEIWPNLVRYAEERNIYIGIENCPMLYKNTWPFGVNMARTPAIWRQMFEIIPSDHFGLNYDPSHLRMQLIDPIAPIREFGKKIFHAHAKDMRVETHQLDDVGSLVVPMDRCTAKVPGYGDIDWGCWVGTLADAGFNGSICVEVEDEAFEGPLESRKRALAISQGVLRPLVR